MKLFREEQLFLFYYFSYFCRHGGECLFFICCRYVLNRKAGYPNES